MAFSLVDRSVTNACEQFMHFISILRLNLWKKWTRQNYNRRMTKTEFHLVMVQAVGLLSMPHWYTIIDGKRKSLNPSEQKKKKKKQITNIELNTSLFGLSLNRVRQSYGFLAKYFVNFHFHLRPFVYCNINLVDACASNLVLSGLSFWLCLIWFLSGKLYNMRIKPI